VFLLSKAKDEVHRVALLWKTDREKTSKSLKSAAKEIAACLQISGETVHAK